MLLGAALYAEGATLSAGLGLSLATNLKLFPFTLGLCLLTGLNRRFWVWFVVGLVGRLVLPAAVLGWSRNAELLQQWLALLQDDATRPHMLDIGSFVALHFGIAETVRTPLALAAGAVVGVTCFRLFRGGETGGIDRFVVPVNGLYVLLFSYLSESPITLRNPSAAPLKRHCSLINVIDAEMTSWHSCHTAISSAYCSTQPSFCCIRSSLIPFRTLASGVLSSQTIIVIQRIVEAKFMKRAFCFRLGGVK